jgi:membrane-anchored protein YejM (alkaline phosphatase superfamily)
MRRIILRFLYILYERVIRKGPYRPAYSNAIINLNLILILHLFFFTILFNLTEYVPFGEKFFISSNFGTVLFVLAISSLVLILLNIFFKEEDVLKIQMGEREKRRGYIILMVYVVLLIASIIILPFIKKG